MIGGIVKTSLIDFQGYLSAVIFTQGCNFNCFYCHNRELISSKEGGLPVTEVLSLLDERKDFLDAVVVSGGEPTLHSGLGTLLSSIKSLGLKCKLDTNGSNPDKVEYLIKRSLVDYVAVDIKGSRSRYAQFAGKEHQADKVYQTLSHLIETSTPHEVRTTMAPTMGIDDLIEIAEELPPSTIWKLQRYVIPELFRKEDEQLIYGDVIPYATEEELLNVLRRIQPAVAIR
ncbi:MAG: anaerobic ribonucleoside-triphosphate reductase activating protein [Sphaerochaetaceae bacterium]